MRVGFCQFEIVHNDGEKNLKTIIDMLNDVKADLIVLPELAVSGYYFEDKEALIRLSKSINPAVISELTALANKTATSYVIGLAEVAEDQLFNTAYVIGKDGVIGKHRKIHLTNNETIFDEGNNLSIIDMGDYKIGIAICFETWFPEFFRRLADQGADIVVSPANFGGPWTPDVCLVRALENSLPIILANRLGTEIIEGERETFSGRSQIIDGFGHRRVVALEAPYVGFIDIDLKAYHRHQNIICDDVLKERNKHRKLK